MNLSEELLGEISEGGLVGTEELQDDLQGAAGKISQMVSKEVSKKFRDIKKKHSLSSGAQVRTDKSGIKDVELALELFVAELLRTKVEGGNPSLFIDTEM